MMSKSLVDQNKHKWWGRSNMMSKSSMDWNDVNDEVDEIRWSSFWGIKIVTNDDSVLRGSKTDTNDEDNPIRGVKSASMKPIGRVSFRTDRNVRHHNNDIDQRNTASRLIDDYGSKCETSEQRYRSTKQYFQTNWFNHQNSNLQAKLCIIVCMCISVCTYM